MDAETSDHKLKAQVSDLKVEVEPSGVKVETKAVGAGDRGDALVARSRYTYH